MNRVKTHTNTRHTRHTQLLRSVLAFFFFFQQVFQEVTAVQYLEQKHLHVLFPLLCTIQVRHKKVRRKCGRKNIFCCGDRHINRCRAFPKFLSKRCGATTAVQPLSEALVFERRIWPHGLISLAEAGRRPAQATFRPGLLGCDNSARGSRRLFTHPLDYGRKRTDSSTNAPYPSPRGSMLRILRGSSFSFYLLSLISILNILFAALPLCLFISRSLSLSFLLSPSPGQKYSRCQATLRAGL